MEAGVAGSCCNDGLVRNKRKRKQRSSKGIGDEVQGRSKFTRGESEEGFPWKNLQLILSLQDKNTDLTEKVDLAFDYVQSSSMRVPNDINYRSHVIDTSRTVSSLSTWVQSVLIYSEKKSRLEKNKPDFRSPGSFLDIRCWQILHFCLEESKRCHTSLTCSKDFLRVIHSIEMDLLSSLSVQPCHEGTISDERLQFYDTVLDCLSYIFSSHGGITNENLELWILVIDKMLELILRVVSGQIEDSILGNFILRLTCSLFEPFARFLKVHPMRKNGFHSFINKLLQPLLQLVHLLRSRSFGSLDEWKTDLSRSAEEVLAQGMFHSIHIDGFLGLQSSNRYRNSSDSIIKDDKLVNKSYHRHLFDKVEKIVALKNESTLVGLGELLHLFARCVVKNKAASVSGAVSMNLDVQSIFHAPTNLSLSRTAASENMDAESRKSIFDFFVQIMEYLLADLSKCLQHDEEEVSILFNVSITLRSINNLLASFIREKLCIKTEDTSDGASRNFLSFIYSRVMPLSAKIAHQKTSCFGSDDKSDQELLISVRKELIITVRHLLDIEYEVLGDDVESLWVLSLSSLPCCYGSMDAPDQSLLFAEILSLGCRLIDLYSDLRQVDTSIFALFRAVRHSVSFVGHSEECIVSSTCSSYTNSLSKFFCSLQFRCSLSKAVKVIPEGQLAKCIQQLSSDVQDSLAWIKSGHQLGEHVKSNPHHGDSLQFQLQAEILGKVLSDAYTAILESVRVTSGNSSLIGDSLEELVEIIRPSLSSLVSLQPDGSDEFFISIDGRTLSKSTGCDNLSMCWILKFLFHLVFSCRSLFRQVISLMASDTSKEMSDFIGDPFLAQSIKDCVEMTDSVDEGFFSWILEPSATLVHVINTVSDICIQDSVVLCPPLLYVLSSMAIQRLVDLNKLIEISYYALKWRSWNKPKDDTDVSPYSKKSVSKVKKEAKDLTKFIMGNILSIHKNQSSTPSFGSGLDFTLFQGQHHDSDTLNFAIGSQDERSLLFAMWYIICEDIDIWCSHALNKDLKSFLTLLIQTSLSYINDKDGHLRTHSMVKPGHEKTINVCQISLKFLTDNTEYDDGIVCRYMAPRFCRILQKSVSSLIAISGKDLGRSPDWVEVISKIEKLSEMQPWNNLKMVPAEFCDRQNISFATCQSLLTLLTWMPEKYFDSKSSLLYITHILNLERRLIDSLLSCQSASSSHNAYQILQLSTTCRRVLQILAVAPSRENVNGSQSPPSSKLSESSFPLLWLLKSLSVMVEFQHAFPEDLGLEANGRINSLLCHTSDLLLTVSRDRFNCIVGSFIYAWKLQGERKTSDPGNEESEQSECLQVNPKEHWDEWESIFQLCKALEEHMKQSVTINEDVCLAKKVESLSTFQHMSKLSMTIACFHGLLQGLASVLGGINSLDGDFRIKFSSYNVELMTRINSCMDTFVSSTTSVVKLLFLDGAIVNMSAFGDNASGAAIVPNLEAFLTEIQQQGLYLKTSLLLKILSGENAEAAILLQHLFIAFSAILTLNLQINLSSSFWCILPAVVGISQFLLLECAKSEMLDQFAICCLDGAVKFLNELGSYFPQFDPLLSRDFYAKLIGLHLRAIGKCISLQGKEARLASQETGSHAKKLNNEAASLSSSGSSQLRVLKKRLRMSFRTYIKKSSKLHLLSAVQAVERALVGVQEGLMANYKIAFGSSNGGEVSSVVTAGIYALDLILKYVTGTKRLNIIKRHILSLVGCLYNIILHLQGPSSFFGCADFIKAYAGPDSGSSILMCVDVLTKISGKPSLFQIDPCHVAQALRLPGVLFQYFFQLQIPKAPINAAAIMGTSNISADGKFSVELYASCCRMLCSTIKNHKSETWHCVAILEDSVAVLLHCLENVPRTEPFSWKVQEAVICADNLRRVYEEVRSQKDVLGQFSYLLLSRYISVYCGFGPARNGIISEADSALRPGLYALLDCCSADDLQLLHTRLGEGSCRSLLAELQHEYKIKYRFEGKV